MTVAFTAQCINISTTTTTCRHPSIFMEFEVWKRSAAVTMVNSFIVSRIDYYNSLLAACSQQQLDKLQRVLNCAARVIYGGRRVDHIAPLLRDNLHWLRIREQITLKLCLLVYKATHGLAPSYIADMCIPIATMSTR